MDIGDLLEATAPSNPPRLAIIPPTPTSPIGGVGLAARTLFLSPEPVELIASGDMLLVVGKIWFPGPLGRCVAMEPGGDGSWFPGLFGECVATYPGAGIGLSLFSGR